MQKVLKKENEALKDIHNHVDKGKGLLSEQKSKIGLGSKISQDADQEKNADKDQAEKSKEIRQHELQDSK